MQSPMLLPQQTPAPKVPTRSTPCSGCSEPPLATSESQFQEYAQAELSTSELIDSTQQGAQQAQSAVVSQGQQVNVDSQTQAANGTATALSESSSGNAHSNQASGSTITNDVVSQEATATTSQVDAIRLVPAPGLIPGNTVGAQAVTSLGQTQPVHLPPGSGAAAPQMPGASQQSSGSIEITSGHPSQVLSQQVDHSLGGMSEAKPQLRGGVGSGSTTQVTSASQLTKEHLQNNTGEPATTNSSTKQQAPASTSRVVALSGLVAQLRDQLTQGATRSPLAGTDVQPTAASSTAPIRPEVNQQSSNIMGHRESGLLQIGEHLNQPPAQARAQEVELQLQQQRMTKMTMGNLRGSLQQMSTPLAVDAAQGSTHIAPLMVPVESATDGGQVIRGSVATGLINQGTNTATTTPEAINGGLLSQESGEANRLGGRLLRGMSAMLNQNGGMMRMRLEPDALGEVRIQMHLNRGSVSVAFEASSAEARGVLQQHLHNLEASLKAQGMTIEQLIVKGGQLGTYQPSQGQEERLGDEQPDSQQDQQDQGAEDDEKRSGKGGFAPLLDLLDLEAVENDNPAQKSTEAI